ncbi:MAG: hypothetical protein RJA47_671 [Actinomycetota bacterium]
MTKSDTSAGNGGTKPRCAWCRHPFPETRGPGRPKKFCSQRCRQWDWVSRQRAAELQLSENELVVAREELDNLKDLIFVLQCAVNDVRQDMTSPRQTKDTLTDMVTWLLDAADPVTLASFGAPVIRS